MMDRSDDERLNELEKNLTELYRRHRPDPRFIAGLEKDLQARLSAMPPTVPSRFHTAITWLASTARAVAWAGGAVLFFLVVLWTVRHLAPPPAADLTTLARLTSPVVEAFQPTATTASTQPSSTPPNVTPTGSPASLPEDAILDSNASPPTSTPAPSATATAPSDQITVNPEVALANLRAGPSTEFAVVGGLRSGMQATAIGQTEDGQWIQLAVPEAPGGTAWIYASLVSYSGRKLAYVVSPPTPTPLPPELSPLPKPAKRIVLTLADSDQSESLVDSSRGEIFITYTTPQKPDRMRLGRLSLACLAAKTRCAVVEISGFPSRASAPMSWSPDGKQAVLYDENGAKFYSFHLASQEFHAVQLGVSLDATSLIWSPNGKWIAARVPGSAATLSGIILIRHDGQKTRPLAENLSGYKNPLGWLNENTLLVQRRQLDIETGYLTDTSLYKVNIDNGFIQKIDTDRPLSSEPVLEPNGSGLVFSSEANGSGEIFRLNLKNGKTTPYRTSGVPQSWSPDGRWLALNTWQGGREGLSVLRADNGNVRPLLTWHGNVLWLPDGKNLLVTTFNDRLNGGDNQTHYYLVSVPEGTVQELVFSQEDLVGEIVALSIRPAAP